MKVKTTYTGCDYITAGKEYEVVLIDKGDAHGFWIMADSGREAYCLFKYCLHLDNVGTWEIIE